MNIKINDDYAITSDEHNVLLKRRIIRGGKSKNPGQEHYTVIGYYSKLEHALIRLIDDKIFSSDAKDFDALLAEVQKVKDEIIKAVQK